LTNKTSQEGIPAVHFYVSPDSTDDAREKLCCHVVGLAWRRGRRIWINTSSDSQTGLLDDLLWIIDDTSFLPHARLPAAHGDPSPILLGYRLEPPAGVDVMINLDEHLPPFYQRFAIIVELVAGDEATRTTMRERYRWYRQQGYTPKMHDT
jgi:DNA polymerase-3 subunit chi